MKIILSSAYNAPIQYYSKFLLGYPIIIEQNDTYIKQSYRNRCAIATTDGVMSLSIPVEYSSTERTKMRDVKISEHGNWQHTHWNAIVSAYNSTPFFEYYKDDFELFYSKGCTSLIDYNNKLLQLTLQLLNVDLPEIFYSSDYVDIADEKDIIDYRELIHPKKPYSIDSLFIASEYYQLFGDRIGFIPNLSILDLLFNMGNESLLILQQSIAKE